MKYEVDLHSFGGKLSSLMIQKGLIDKKGNPDPIALHNLLYPNNTITEQQIKNDRQKVTDTTRKYSNWLKGKNYPKTIPELIDLCNVLNCDLDYFFSSLEAPTHDLDYISNTTGLSLESINELNLMTTNDKLILNTFIETKCIDKMRNSIENFYCQSQQEIKISGFGIDVPLNKDESSKVFKYIFTQLQLDIFDTLVNNDKIKLAFEQCTTDKVIDYMLNKWENAFRSSDPKLLDESADDILNSFLKILELSNSKNFYSEFNKPNKRK